MTRSRGWFVDYFCVVCAALAVSFCVVWPIATLSVSIAGSSFTDGALPQAATTGIGSELPATSRASTSTLGITLAPSGALALFLRSTALALSVAIVGALLAWPASRVFRQRAGSLAGNIAITLILAPLALPPWLLYASVWLCVGPGTWIGDLVERANAVGVVRSLALALSLIVWAAAPAFAVLVVAGGRSLSSVDRLLYLDGARMTARVRAALAGDGRALTIAIATVGIFLFSETTVFDLAQVQTYGFELRALESLGASPSEILGAAWPALALAACGVLLTPLLVRSSGGGRLGARDTTASALDPRRARRGGSALLVCAAFPVILPAILLSLFLCALWETPRASDFFLLHGTALSTTVLTSSLAAIVVTLFAIALRVGVHASRRPLRALSLSMLVLAAFVGLVPGTTTAIALESAFNSDAFGFVYDTPVIVLVTLVVRTMIVAAVVVFALAACEPPSATRLRALDGDSALARWRGMRHEIVRAALVTFPVAFAWSLGELAASGRMAPPGMDWLATDILNAIHYQRPETVLLGTLALLIVGVVGAVSLSSFVRQLPRGFRQLPRGFRQLRRGVPLVALASCLGIPVLITLPACARRDTPAVAAPSDEPPGFDRDAPKVTNTLLVDRTFTGVGRGRGQFNGPRVVACDPRNGEVYVIDKDARVQRFDPDGTVRAEWAMSKKDRGKPVGASVAPDGTLVVADTHEHRIVAFTPEGVEKWTLGSYGRDAGQFIYPTDIAFAPDGRMFIAEYGGNDRVQVFSAERTFLYEFGSCGTEPGEFLRAQVLAYDAARDELYVADSGNHRIQVFTGDGEFRRAIGTTGRSPGQFAYPFGLVLEIDGIPVTSLSDGNAPTPDTRRRTILVAEHSNHRVQRLDAVSGEVLAVAGGIGRDVGRVKYPWALEPTGIGSDGQYRFALCDHGNSRIQFFSMLLPATLPEPQSRTSE